MSKRRSISVAHLYLPSRQWDKYPEDSNAHKPGFEEQFHNIRKLAEERFRSWKLNKNYFEAWDASFAAINDEMKKLDPEIIRKLYRVVLETQIFFSVIREAYKSGLFKGAMLVGYGQEGVGAGVACSLREEDWIARDQRSVSAAIARGIPVIDFFKNHYFKADSPTGGYDPNIHFCVLGRKDLGFMVSDMGMGTVVINGAVGYANRRKGVELGRELKPEERIVGVAMFGDGASTNGLSYSGMRFAKARNLPILEVILNNQIALRTPPREEHGDTDLTNLGFGIEMPSLLVDGDDPLEVYLGAKWLIHFARIASHPALIHCLTFRRCGHNESEDTSYHPKLYPPGFYERMMESHQFPLPRIRALGESLGVLTKEEIEKTIEETNKRVEAASRQALASPDPVADRKVMRKALIDPECKKTLELSEKYPPSSSTRRMTLKEAIREAMEITLTNDPCFEIFGEDVGLTGGVYNVTAGLNLKFGDRVFNTILDEGAIGGYAVGYALAGGRASGEYQFMNFMFAGPSPMLTLAATRPYMMKTPVPIVMRGPTGYSPQSNHYHENWIESYLVKAHGIKVVIPSTPKDAKGLFLSAVKDDDCVFFLEEMGYYEMQGEVPEGEYYIPLGVAEIIKFGKDITLVTYGPKMREVALRSAEVLSGEGIDIEVIDLRTIVPWDRRTVFESLDKTKRLMILHSDSKILGFGAEIAAQISEVPIFYKLKGRIVRLGALNTPSPSALSLEDARLPQITDVLYEARKLMEESL